MARAEFNRDIEATTSNPPNSTATFRTETVRRWQILEKETGFKFYLNGRIVVGPSMKKCVILMAHMTATLALFLLYDGSHYLEGRMHLLRSWSVPFLLILLYIITLTAILKTIFTEPGYHAKPPPNEQRQNFMKYISSAKYNPQGSSESDKTSRYCQICQMFRRPQVSHCRTCNVCFKRSDHHCDILGVCIAKRNYPSFFLFTATVLIFYGIIFILGVNSLGHVILTEMENLTPKKVLFPSLFLVLTGFFFPPCGIVVMIVTPFIHVYQILTNRTSKERNRKIWPQDKPKTFKGWISFCISNCHEILFSQTPHSELFAREKERVPLGTLKTLTWAHRPILTMELYNSARPDLGGDRLSSNGELEIISKETLERVSFVQV